MNKYDTIRHLADGNAKRFRPLREEDVVPSEDGPATGGYQIPYFRLSRTSTVVGGYDITMFNYHGHDNAPRMPHYCNFIMKHVLPNVSTEHDVSGYYPIELHDTHAYLPKRKDVDYSNALVFAKDVDDKYPCLIPDPYMIDNYGGRLAIRDDREFEKKESKIMFAGCTTGSMDPAQNQRLQLCEWSLANRGFADFRITNVVQMREADVRKVYARFDDMLMAPIPQQAQYAYKYLLNLDGNTACWDRLMWIASSKSLAFKYNSKHVLWYYPLFQEGTHFMGVDKDTMLQKFTYCQSNPVHAKWMVSNANVLAQNYANHLAAVLYTARLFENFAENRA